MNCTMCPSKKSFLVITNFFRLITFLTCVLLFNVGCGIHGKNNLYAAFNKPRDINTITVYVEHAGCLDVWKKCSDLSSKVNGFPIVYPVYACAEVGIDNWCNIYTCVDSEVVMNEEYTHCEGWEN